MASVNQLPDFLVAHMVHISPLLHDAGRLDPDEGLAQGYRPEPGVEEEQPDVGVDVEEARHVHVVGERGGETYDAYHALGGLNLFGLWKENIFIKAGLHYL